MQCCLSLVIRASLTGEVEEERVGRLDMTGFGGGGGGRGSSKRMPYSYT